MAEQNQDPMHVNVFLKGMMQDIDINDIPADKYLIGEDIKLMDKLGQGYVLTNVDGNTYAFSLTLNFVPLGYVEHKDIMYIISCNKNGLGEGEVGSFPSFDKETGKWVLEYAPLRNYSDNRVGKEKENNFKTDLFNMNPKNRVEVIAKDHFDGSVDLYFADGENQLRVVNTGFTQDGTETFTAVPYTNYTFETKVNLVLGSRTSSQISLNNVTTGGSLKYGTYIFFIKYMTESFDQTYFVAESKPVPVFKGVNTIGSVRGGSASLNSDKKITLTISNTDQSYKYIKIGYIRHFSDFNGVVTYQFGEINNRYEVDQNNTTMNIDIIGTEGEVYLTEEEILLKKDTEIIPQTINQLANRLFGANWKKVKTHNDALTRFAKLIKIGYNELMHVDDEGYALTNGTHVSKNQYSYYVNYAFIDYFRGETYPFGIVAELNDGSFSETYPLNGVDMWNKVNNDNPNYDPSGSDKGNYDGIFRFPNTTKLPTIVSPWTIRKLGVKFTTEDAWMSIMAANENNWIRFNVRAIYFVRGDRSKNLKYQGLMIGACAPFLDDPNNLFDLTKQCSLNEEQLNFDQDVPGPEWSDQYSYFQRRYPFSTVPYWASNDSFWGNTFSNDISQFPSTQWDSRFPPAERWGPIYRGYAPMYYSRIVDGDIYDRSYVSRFFLKPDKYCFYSPDVLFNAFNDVSDLNYCWRVGKTINPRSSGVTTDNNSGLWNHADLPTNLGVGNKIFPRVYRAFMGGSFITSADRLTDIQDKIMVGENGIVKPADNGYNSFINGSDEPFSNELNTWVYCGSSEYESPDHDRYFTRSMVMAKYIGLDFNAKDMTAGSLLLEDWNLDIVNLYSTNPTQVVITNLFPNLNTIRYRKISEPILISRICEDIIAGATTGISKQSICWQGDCFLQRTSFKQMYWAGASANYYYDPNLTEWNKTTLMDNTEETIYGKHVGHGMLFSIVTENAHNIAMRSDDPPNSFFPAEDVLPFTIEAYNTENVESFKLNYGYDQSLSNNMFLAYDPALPDKDLQYMTRIKYSDVTIPGSYIDSYRSFKILNYVDYNSNFGPIKRLCVVFDKLIAIQENAIIELYTNERQTQMGVEGQSAILGYGDVLSPNFRKMSNFGTQHKWSVVQADTLFGVDWKRQIIWEVGTQRSGSGTLFMDAMDITKESFIEKWMRETALSISNNRSDKFNSYGDDTLSGEGIVSGYDLKTKDVYFIFHKKTENI